jgi:hypothetical protein
MASAPADLSSTLPDGMLMPAARLRAATQHVAVASRKNEFEKLNFTLQE